MIAELASRASDAAETGSAPLDPILDDLEALTGQRQNHDYWLIFHGGEGPDFYAQAVSEPMPAPISSLASHEIKSLLELHDRFASDEDFDEAIQDRCLRYLERCLGEAFNTNLLFYPYRDYDLDGMVDEINLRTDLLEKGGGEAIKKYEYDIALKMRSKIEEKPWLANWVSYKLMPGYGDTYRALVSALEDAKDFWWVIGGFAAVLHGSWAEPIDQVEVIVSAKDFEDLEQRLPLKVMRDARMGIYQVDSIGEWAEPEMTVQFLVDPKLGDEGQLSSVTPLTRVKDSGYRTGELYIPELGEMIQMLRKTRQWVDIARAQILDKQEQERQRKLYN